MTGLTRRTLIGTAGAMLAAGPLGAQRSAYLPFGYVERLNPALDALIPRDAIVEEIANGFTWIEGPAWIGGPRGFLLASDVPGNRIHRWSEQDGASVWLDPSGFEGQSPELREPGTNGLLHTRQGLLVADSGNRYLGRIDLKTRRKSPIVDRFEGRRFNSPNDLCLSPTTGSIYFTDPPYGLKGQLDSSVREMDYTGVFRLARDGKLSLIGKFDFPNGIGISPDGKTLYHTDRTLGWVAHALDPEGNSLTYRPFTERGPLAGGDGLKIDMSGNMWTSSERGIAIFTPGGKQLGAIHANDVISNCEIGADGYLYMSTNHRLTRIKVNARKIAII
jgi:gluconolactonase